MSKLIKRITKEDLIASGIVDEGVLNETTETEKTKETLLVNEPIYTAGGNVDLSKEALGNVELECTRCKNKLTVGRQLGVNLMCPSCGMDQFISFSNFRMENVDGNVLTIEVGGTVSRKGRMIWKIT